MKKLVLMAVAIVAVAAADSLNADSTATEAVAE